MNLTWTEIIYPQTEEVIEEAVVDQAIRPGKSGRVLYRASWWPARCEQDVTIDADETVYVVGRKNITLLVMPAR